MSNVECQMYIYTVRNSGRETLDAQCQILNVKCIYYYNDLYFEHYKKFSKLGKIIVDI